MCNAAGYYLNFLQFHLNFATVCCILFMRCSMLAALYFVGTTLRDLSKVYDSQKTSTFLEEVMSDLAKLATEVYLTKSVHGTSKYRNTDAQ
jgi:hypothetical protein